MTMATLITGGSGFVGLSLAERLIAAGEKVVLFDVSAPLAGMLERPELAGAILLMGDVRDAADVDGALAAYGIDRVIHAAAITPNQARELDQPRRIVEVNIVGTVNLLERVVPSVRRLDSGLDERGGGRQGVIECFFEALYGEVLCDFIFVEPRNRDNCGDAQICAERKYRGQYGT